MEVAPSITTVTANAMLVALAAKPGSSKSGIISAALKAYLDGLTATHEGERISSTRLRDALHRLGDVRGLAEMLGPDRFRELYEMSPEGKNERIFEVELLYQDPKILKQEIEELLMNLEEDILTKKLEKIMATLADVERAGEPDMLQNILKESQIGRAHV